MKFCIVALTALLYIFNLAQKSQIFRLFLQKGDQSQVVATIAIFAIFAKIVARFSSRELLNAIFDSRFTTCDLPLTILDFFVFSHFY